MKVGIVGSGGIANVHGDILNELGHKIVFVVGNNHVQMKAYAEKYNIEFTETDLAQALKHDVDCVHICTPPTSHFQFAKIVLNHKKHIICEKPMSLSLPEAKELYLLSQKSNMVTAVNFNVRFHEACIASKKVIQSLDFGQPVLIHGHYFQEFHVLPAAYSWRYIPEVSGHMRATSEIGSHWIDLARFLTGLEIKEVSANFGKFNEKRHLKDGVMYAENVENSEEIFVESEDAAVISIRFSNGAIGSLLLSEVSHGRSNDVSIEITSAKKSIWWNSETPYQINSATKSSGVNTLTNAFAGGFPTTFKDFFTEVYKDIASKEKSVVKTYPTFYDGYVNTMVCQAIYESANSNGAWISVDTNYHLKD